MRTASISNLQPALVAEITSLGRAGNSLRAIERATGIRRERVSAVLKQAGVAVGKARPSAITVTGPAATTASAPLTATVSTVTATGQPRGDPGDRIDDIDWRFPVGHRHRALELPEIANGWSLPLELRAAHVRALREGVAIQHRLVDAAPGIGIDRWIGRLVRDLTDVATVVAEIHDALTVARGRIRR